MREPGKEVNSDGRETVAVLEDAIGYRFVNRQLLTEALTHRSCVNERRGEEGVADNERLEFLGDAVLGLLVGKMLFTRFPGSREGVLARMKASLVGEETLAGLAAARGLGCHLRLGRGEERSGGRERRSLLANTYEALLAAVYLDGGAEPVERIVEQDFAPLLADIASGISGRDFKTEFQEAVQLRFGRAPTYELIAADGPPHDRLFTVAAFVGGERMGEGSGRSKKEAEQAAARGCLARLAADAGKAE